jgi:O-antigen/teichoic acid export membrane protein
VTADSGQPPGGALPADEVRRRAIRAVALLGGRAALILLLGVAANIGLAKLLTPREFGVVALGLTLVVLGQALAEGGLGASLIRRETPPTHAELAAVNALQVAATGAVAVAIAGLGVPFGSDGLLVAAMAASLPVTVLRTPSLIVLEREVRFREIATVDVVEAVVFYASALIAVAAGMGVWGVAVATALRAFVGTALIIFLGPVGFVRPRWAWREVRPLVGFGAQVQVVSMMGLVREQVLNATVALVAGVGALGVWSFVYRVLRLPYALFATIGRVAYPAIAQILAAGGDARPVLERASATLALANGATLVLLAAFAPAVPTLVGPEWGEVPATLLWASVALLVNAPIWVLTSSYFFAAGEPGPVLRALLLHTVVWFGLVVPLLGPLGVKVIGMGWIAAAAATGFVLVRATHARTGARLARSVAPPTASALLAIGVGWGVSAAGNESVLRAVLGVAAGELVLLGALAIVKRSLLRDALALVAETVRGRAPLPRAGTVEDVA